MKKNFNFKPGSNMTIEKASDFFGTIIKLIKYLGKYKKSLIFVIIFTILSSAFNIVGPKILGNATTLLFEGVMNKISGNNLGIDFYQLTIANNIIFQLYIF